MQRVCTAALGSTLPPPHTHRSCIAPPNPFNPGYGIGLALFLHQTIFCCTILRLYISKKKDQQQNQIVKHNLV